MLLHKAMHDPKNRGFHLIVAAGKVYRAKSGQGASKIIDELDRKHPEETLAITYLPKAQSLILL